MLVNSDGTPFKRDTNINIHMLSARDRGRIDEIIKALKFLEEDKMLCYADEIDFLKRIREW